MLAFKTIESLPLNERLSDVSAAVLRAELTRYGLAIHAMEASVEPDLEINEDPRAQSVDGRSVARLLVTQAAILAHEGELDSAIQACLGSLHVARVSGAGPDIGWLSRSIAIRTRALTVLQRILAQGEPGDVALTRAQNELEEQLETPFLLTGLRVERAREHASLLGFGVIVENPPPDTVGSRGSMLRYMPFTRLWIDANRCVDLECFNEAIRIAELPMPRDADWDAWRDRIDLAARNWFLALGVQELPWTGQFVETCARHRSAFAATIALIAAERLRQRTGEWPTSPSAIDRSILGDPLNDPRTGAPFRFVHEDGQFKVLGCGSLGEDAVLAAAWDPELRGQRATPELSKAN
jgi:hypothetical protein